jgi:ABC-2 type transport system ATP-binding protein
VTAAISVSGLVKGSGATRALDHLDLMVRAGEVHGFLGPNGAGKTTTLRVLLRLLRKDAGAATVLRSGGMLTATGLNVPDACLGGHGVAGRRRYR